MQDLRCFAFALTRFLKLNRTAFMWAKFLQDAACEWSLWRDDFTSGRHLLMIKLFFRY